MRSSFAFHRNHLIVGARPTWRRPVALVLTSWFCLACGPSVKDVAATVKDDAVVVSGQVSDMPIGADVQISGWGGTFKVPREDIGADGKVETLVPLYKLPAGTHQLKMAVDDLGKEKASKRIEVTIPAHASIAIVGCADGRRTAGSIGSPDGPPHGPPSDSAPTAQLAGPFGNVSVTGDRVKTQYPIYCGINKDGYLAVKVEGPVGLKLEAGAFSAVVGDDGTGQLDIAVNPWIAGLAVEAFAARLDRETGATDWADVRQATIQPLQADVKLSAGEATGTAKLIIGEQLAKPVDREDKRAASSRMIEMVALAQAYLAAAQLSKRTGKPAAEGSVLLFDLDRKPQLEPPLIDTALFVVGPATTLAEISRFAVFSEKKETTHLDDCGPYREVDLGLGASDTPSMIRHVRVDVNIQVWSHDGKAIASDTLLGGGGGCPKSISSNLEGPWRDRPPTYSIGDWVLDQLLPQ